MAKTRVGSAILIDIGGVLVRDYLAASASEWGTRLSVSPQAFLEALFSGNDAEVLVGRVSEAAWWKIVGGRLRIEPELIKEIQSDLAGREIWDEALVTCLRRIRGSVKTAMVSNAWPRMRTRMTGAGLVDLVDAVVLSCEVGYAKPDPRIFMTALDRLDVDPADVLFIDDMSGHVAAARSLGMAGHVHVHAEDTVSCIHQFLGAG